MNLRALSYVVAVADLRNFTHAAEQCHVSQPTLSAQIKKLEEYLGIKIFERNNKRIMITDEGDEIIHSARRILVETETIQDIAERAKNPFTGTFRLGAFPTLSTYIVNQHPKLTPHQRPILTPLKSV
ncbi:LysR family transcriptional regulator, hydrogen peroxide-inducible genes activator [Mariprofundus micogutta]|uniref:LysR family transcriptional regulator, hydrogen peroxide-inducible genes activator n=1 Tax=Mariprofundus micogutta TaxID=1921010 RepID=A0A1L8CQX5_9PROT|nr:LysR family transcriptional regulator [Mariprofundus micogutta]GAV21335.1 LysR family transcriptional regulator, hydrogen peroxide-inducible genes activator [Mariprofundus micogutta]